MTPNNPSDASEELSLQQVQQLSDEAARRLVNKVSEFNQKYSYPEVQARLARKQTSAHTRIISALALSLAERYVVVPDEQSTDIYREGTFEVCERAEEAIIDKQARVVEEVHIKKDVQERTENIQDTVRRTDVDVAQIPSQTRTAGYTQSGTTDRTRSNEMGRASDEGTIERGASKLGDATERAMGTDLDQGSNTEQRDRRNNY